MAPRSPRTYERIYAVTRRIPPGRVATYGQVAALAGLAGHARQVGYALHALQDDDVPWHRVLNARGEVSRRAEPGAEELQRLLLKSEGIRFAAGRIDLARWRWQPRSAPIASRGQRKPRPAVGASRTPSAARRGNRGRQ